MLPCLAFEHSIRQSRVHFSHHHALSTTASFLLRQQAPQTQIIYHILHLAHLVLNTITPLPQNIILQIQNLEPGMHVLDEPANSQWTAEVPQCDGVAG
jgi:hypothetical protein